VPVKGKAAAKPAIAKKGVVRRSVDAVVDKVMCSLGRRTFCKARTHVNGGIGICAAALATGDSIESEGGGEEVCY
jgi:hypothetical protein